MSSNILTPEIVELNYLRMEVHPELSLITLFWKRQVTNSELRTGFYTAAEVARNYKCKYWLGDARNTSMLNIADQDLVVKDLIAIISSSGIKKIARIVSPAEQIISDSFSLKLKIESANADFIGFATNIFTDDESAKKWLFS